jgi:hypothetical protein
MVKGSGSRSRTGNAGSAQRPQCVSPRSGHPGAAAARRCTVKTVAEGDANAGRPNSLTLYAIARGVSAETPTGIRPSRPFAYYAYIPFAIVRAAERADRPR